MSYKPLSEAELFAPAEWDPERYGIGVRQIDDQHRQLLLHINAFASQLALILADAAYEGGQAQSQSVSGNGGPFGTAPVTGAFGLPTPASHLRQFNALYQRGSEMASIVAKLVAYCLRCLGSEDHLLETYGYADRGSQALEHEAFIERVARVHHSIETYAAEERDMINLLAFLKLWIRDHIPRDRKYAPLLLERGLGS